MLRNKLFSKNKFQQGAGRDYRQLWHFFTKIAPCGNGIGCALNLVKEQQGVFPAQACARQQFQFRNDYVEVIGPEDAIEIPVFFKVDLGQFQTLRSGKVLYQGGFAYLSGATNDKGLSYSLQRCLSWSLLYKQLSSSRAKTTLCEISNMESLSRVPMNFSSLFLETV